MLKYSITSTLLFFNVFLFAGDYVTGVVRHASTSNCADGSIDISVVNGLEPYTYAWTGPNGFSATTQDISGILPGTYTVAVEDAGCGRVVKTFEVKSDPSTLFVLDKANVQYCSAEGTRCTGSITLGSKGPLAGWTFQWSGPNGFTSSGSTIIRLCPGYYTVTATNDRGCTVELEENICCCDADNFPGADPQPLCSGALSSPNITVQGTVSSPPTRTSGNGSITLNVSGGNGQYLFIWNGPNGFKSNTKNLSGLSQAGQYCVTVTDGCSRASRCFTVAYCSESTLKVSGNVTNTCSGLSFGAVNTSVTGGTPPYTYVWNNGNASPSLTDISAGQYCVVVKDASGCSTSACFNVGLNQISRNQCTFSCNGRPVKQLSRSYVYDPSDCRYIRWYCSDGFYLGREYLGTVARISGCTIIETCRNGQEYSRITGTPCRDCIFGRAGSQIVSCILDYCYFPGYNSSVVRTIVREFRSVTSIRVGENSPYCTVEVFDDCSGGATIYRNTHLCNSIPFSDGDCATSLPPGSVVQGPLGPSCGIGGFELALTGSLGIQDSLTHSDFFANSHTVSLNTDNMSYFSELERKKLTVDRNATCHHIEMKFTSDLSGKANIEFFTIYNEPLFKGSVEVIEGMNRLVFSDVFPSTRISDTILVKIILPDSTEKANVFSLFCDEIKVSGQGLIVGVSPIPFHDILNIEISVEDTDRVDLVITNNLGQVVASSQHIEVAKSYSKKLDLSNLPSGMYVLTVNGQKGRPYTKKIIKQ